MRRAIRDRSKETQPSKRARNKRAAVSETKGAEQEWRHPWRIGKNECKRMKREKEEMAERTMRPIPLVRWGRKGRREITQTLSEITSASEKYDLHRRVWSSALRVQGIAPVSLKPPPNQPTQNRVTRNNPMTMEPWMSKSIRPNYATHWKTKRKTAWNSEKTRSGQHEKRKVHSNVITENMQPMDMVKIRLNNEWW